MYTDPLLHAQHVLHVLNLYFFYKSATYVGAVGALNA